MPRINVLLNTKEMAILPFDHHQYLATILYDLLESVDTAYAEKMHDECVPWPDDPERSSFKPFCHGRLTAFNERVIEDGYLVLPGRVSWTIGSTEQEFVEKIMFALMKNRAITFNDKNYSVEDVQVEPPLYVSDSYEMRLNTPLLIDVRQEDGRHRYVLPRDSDFEEIFRQRLMRKHYILRGSEAKDKNLFIRFDPSEVESGYGIRKRNYKGRACLGTVTPFMIAGSRELIKTGYEAGFGQRTALGYGMVRLSHAKG